MTAQVQHVVVGVLCDRQKKTGRSPGPGQVIETDAGEFGDRDGQDRKIDACDAKSKGKKADECAGCSGDRHDSEQPEPWPDAEMYE